MSERDAVRMGNGSLYWRFRFPMFGAAGVQTSVRAYVPQPAERPAESYNS